VTRQELEIAGKRALSYPKNRGTNWGIGPLLDLDSIETPKMIAAKPHLIRYG
jgi:hypothetical protein